MTVEGKSEDTSNSPTYERVPQDELARLRRIEEAAREVMNQMQGRRSATPLLAAVAGLRSALREEGTDSPPG
jgi:hypothetical protein